MIFFISKCRYKLRIENVFQNSFLDQLLYSKLTERKLLFSDINLLLELFISLKQFEGALDVMHRHCSAQFKSSISKDDLTKMSPGT
jgi:hypothetical protein